MGTIAELLQEVINQKEDLAENLTAKGVEAESTETLNSLVPKVLDIVTEGIDTSDATATASDILLNKTAYISDGSKVTGTIISKSAQTYTPSKSDQTINSGQYLSGDQTISGDAYLVSANIKSGINIFGVSGAVNVIDTTMATGQATASDILVNKSAFVNGSKVDGTITSKAAQTYTPSTIDQTILLGQYLSGDQTIEGSATLLPSNIKSGVSIFGVEGTYTGGGGGGGLVMNTIFRNVSTAITDYGSTFYVSNSASPVIALTPLATAVSTYPEFCSEGTDWEFRVANDFLGWSSTQECCSILPITINIGTTVFIKFTMSVNEGRIMVIKLVRATGSGSTLAANIVDNANIAGSFVDCSMYIPYTGRTNYVTVANKLNGFSTEDTYYLYFETVSDNLSPYIRDIEIYTT